MLKRQRLMKTQAFVPWLYLMKTRLNTIFSSLEQDSFKRESLYELAKLEVKRGNHSQALSVLKIPRVSIERSDFLAFAKEWLTKAGGYDTG